MREILKMYNLTRTPTRKIGFDIDLSGGNFLVTSIYFFPTSSDLSAGK